jgi:hypothetical protein
MIDDASTHELASGIAIESAHVTSIDKEGNAHLVVTLTREPDEKLLARFKALQGLINKEDGGPVLTSFEREGVVLTFCARADEILETVFGAVEGAIRDARKEHEVERGAETRRAEQARNLDAALQEKIGQGTPKRRP